jgi:hypothetical protein
MTLGRAIRFGLLAAALVAAWMLADERGRSAGAHSHTQAPVRPANATAAKSEAPDAAWTAIVRKNAPTSPASATPEGGTSPLPGGPFGPNVAALKRRTAAGDVAAARALVDGFERCRFYQPPSDGDSIARRAENDAVNGLSLGDQIVDQLKKKGVDTAAIPQPATMDVYNDALKRETALDADCRDVDHGEAEHWLDWYARAAALGDRDARIGYISEILRAAEIESYATLRQQKADAAVFLQQAFEDGDPRSLDAIAFAFRNGLYGEPDPFLAYAYDYAASLAPDADSSTLPWATGFARLAIGPSTQRYYLSMLNASPLDPERIEDAKALGQALYAQCCGGSR